MQYLVNCKQKRITYKKIFAAHPKKGKSKEFDEIKRGQCLCERTPDSIFMRKSFRIF
jgi:hypothetical protein